MAPRRPIQAEAAGKTAAAGRRVAFCLSPDMSLSALLMACEPLRAVNRFFQRPAYDLVFVAPSSAPVRSGIGIPVTPHATFADRSSVFDMVVVAAAYDQDDAYKAALGPFLRHQARCGALMGGIDFGTVFLAELGLLDGYRASVHWDVADMVHDRFPAVGICDDLFVVDRDRATCGGHVAANDLFLTLVEKAHGTEMARFVEADIISAPARPAETRQPVPHDWGGRVGHDHLRQTLDIMEDHIRTPLSIGEIADRLGVSIRQLQLLSRRHLNDTLSNRYLEIRLKAARHLLVYSDKSICEIVAATGFRSASTFGRAFRRRYRSNAQRYRKHFARAGSQPHPRQEMG